jgi:hypothetical protein
VLHTTTNTGMRANVGDANRHGWIENRRVKRN